MAQESTTNQPVPLSVLQVWQRLEVGPVVLERNRLVAPYRLFKDEQAEPTQIDLVYRYEEPVWEPNDPGAQNLAALIAAQVAINYGLFCHEIVFRGPYDRTDQMWLQEAFENTAQEIYIKKFLQPNPFLTGAVRELPVVRRASYLQARLRFPDATTSGTPPVWQWWSAEHSRHAVLSSGGKDSLVSFGLLRELGYEAHPIFVNESGRHWFTARNAFDYLQKHEPRTTRVWTNSDRVFNWFLRQMPWIRPDFQQVRADIYPIRLWTVAVFLFGVLPLLRKRKIGRLLIGNEFDTTARDQHEGIPHYDGLYDQSLDFDEHLSRFFLSKGWGVSQFSVLRPLSELLIETILAHRYPDLLAQQTSCHAAHKDQESERFLPCGRCEKCRRIVGMLVAIDVDPQICGYRTEQIEEILRVLPTAYVLQKQNELGHMLYLLAQRGRIEVPEEQREELRPFPEAVSLRFCRSQSPLDSIPVDLRRPLYQIYLEHADGVLRESAAGWEPFSLWDDPGLRLPYPFEIEAEMEGVALASSPSVGASVRVAWGELTWTQAERNFKSVDVALLPVGAIEQHGPHLPLDTDAFDAVYLAQRVAMACSPPRPVVLPLLPYGVSYHHNDFKGTISVSNEAMAQFVYEIGMSVVRNGLRKLVIINGHGGNDATLNHAAQMINRDSRCFVCVDTGATSDVDLYRLIETPNDVHAGELETSTTLAIRPHLVDMELAQPEVPEFSSHYLNFTTTPNVSWHAYTKRFSDTGIMGDPTRASAGKGRHLWEIMIAHLVAFVEQLKHMPLSDIYQKRY